MITRTPLRFITVVSLMCFALAVATSAQQTYRYIRSGNAADAQPKTAPGVAMMGGGTDLDEAFRWLCEKGGRGDFLILRAHGDDDYNSYVNDLCKPNSVATLIIPDHDAAMNPAVADIIRHAEAIFIAGGDQSFYVRGWQGTPVQDAINAQVAAGRPIGGTSAGLAVLGEFVYACLLDKPDDKDLASSDVLPNPYFPRVTVIRDFLKVPHLDNLITDTHFAKRDRMGRSLGFLARIMQDGWSTGPREVAIDEKSAVLMEPDGKSVVVGKGKGAYFMKPGSPPAVCQKNQPLTFAGIAVYRVPSGGRFNLAAWSGDGGVAYTLSVEQGKIVSTQPNHSVY